MKVNKFNLLWQLARVKAREISDVEEKINYVMDFLDDFPTEANYHRVLNWLKMTLLGYKGKIRDKFYNKINVLITKKENFQGRDIDEDWSVISDEDLLKVYHDLKKRKYNFQFHSVPKDHVVFVERLEMVLKKRNLL